MSWLTRQNRMSYLKARDLHLFSLRRINNQSPQPEQSRTSQSAFGAPCRRPSSDPRISGNQTYSNIMEWMQICSNWTTTSFADTETAWQCPKQRYCRNSLFLYTLMRMRLQGQAWKHMAKLCKTPWKNLFITKTVSQAESATMKEGLRQKFLGLLPARPAEIILKGAKMSQVNYTHTISCYTVQSDGFMHWLQGEKKFTASLPFQPWRQEYLVKWCKANQNIAQAGIIWHWMIPMRTYGLMGALSQVAKANAFALDTDYHSKLHDL